MSNKYVYEIDPVERKISKIDLTEEIETKIGEMESYQVKKTYLHVCFNNTTEGVEWILDLPDIPNRYRGSFEKISFKGTCYLSGTTYKIGDNGRWRVISFPSSFDRYISEWVKWK